MNLDLLRHGESVGGRIYRGSQDDPLTEKGWGQMLESTKDKKWDFIASSPLSRCHSFAKYLAEMQNIPCQIFNDFEELGFGAWQGKSAKDIGLEVVNNFKQDPVNNQPVNAENLYNFQTRVLNSFNNIKNNHSNKSVLIVAHAGVIRVIKSHLLNLDIEKIFTMNIVSASCEYFDI